ncbi:MAG: bifunctional 4-hydroxy-3-methylbut-2-enyl diphosphate reductase/30S ribosomal protein S1 [Oscillospiraceae bacterium]|nr:bifunctional 4-hydroxy-3-methylbut-2-enyl diphosphate reductase/30S ribosomal protein S1 [Oscillospiraceae bacterium]MBQ4544108.1 bifunctional 4-hydroxy-3-methylbut-2-enyl diphosphate reductase/30S ribosomal protein S1 [Oscillospiraceae bacterium]
MAKITVAETAGFCFGVRRAVDIAEKLGRDGVRACTIGPIIHNAHVVDHLKRLGVPSVNTAADVPVGSLAVIRSHGVARSVYDELDMRGIKYSDATCPYVMRIHKIVREKSEQGYQVIIVGKRSHPEVLGIAGQCEKAEIVGSEEEMSELLKNRAELATMRVCAVSQTTVGRKIWESCVKNLKKVCTNCEIFDTICLATDKRQTEAARLASMSDVMVVIGDRTSSNTQELVEICRSVCPKVIRVENADEIDLESISGAENIGITAGASTPDWIIKEVKGKMSEEIKNFEGESFEEMLLGSLKTFNNGDKVVGVITAITPSDVQVDLGAKYAGYIPYSEIGDDADAADKYKVGDEIECSVIRVNDVEGIITLSKKRLDAIKGWDDVELARQDKTTVEGTVIDVNAGGVIVSVRGLHVFVPASQTGLPRNAEMSELLKKKVQLKIKEVNRARRRIVGSIREVEFEARRAASERVWADIEVGKAYKGVVRSLTSYGAFVDIGGVDGMVHISEMSWTRIGHPSEMFKEGQEVDVFVLALDAEKKKISLGYRKEEDNPWTKFMSAYSVDDTAKVKIVKLMPFGAFAEIVPGVDGLIHISQITNTHIAKPADVLKEGDEVEAKITAVDEENKKVSLSIRALIPGEEAPAEDAEEAPADEADAVVATSGEEVDILPEESAEEAAE